MILNVISRVTGFGFEIAMLSFLAVMLIPPFAVKKIWTEFNYGNLSLKHLIPVAFFSFLPVLGGAAGGPDMGPEYLVLIAIGAVGGLFWSTPFAAWSYYKSRDNQSIPSGDLSGNIPDSNQSDE